MWRTTAVFKCVVPQIFPFTTHCTFWLMCPTILDSMPANEHLLASIFLIGMLRNSTSSWSIRFSGDLGRKETLSWQKVPCDIGEQSHGFHCDPLNENLSWSPWWSTLALGGEDLVWGSGKTGFHTIVQYCQRQSAFWSVSFPNNQGNAANPKVSLRHRDQCLVSKTCSCHQWQSPGPLQTEMHHVGL